jgi:hypothetical protein
LLSDVSNDVCARVRAIIDDCARRRKAGESLSDEDILAAHADPKIHMELRQALSHLRMVDRAFAEADHSAATNDADAQSDGHKVGHSPSTQRLRIRCPLCFTPSDRVPDTPWEPITCGKCGNCFRLAGVESTAIELGTSRSIGHFDLIERIGMGGFGAV